MLSAALLISLALGATGVASAAPRFLGTLRSQLAPRTTTEPYTAIDKNVVGQKADAISRLIDGLDTRR